jgi:hypothetical protein
VAEVDYRLAAAGRLEAAIQAALMRAEQLRQAILARAFAGRLETKPKRQSNCSG